MDVHGSRPLVELICIPRDKVANAPSLLQVCQRSVCIIGFRLDEGGLKSRQNPREFSGLFDHEARDSARKRFMEREMMFQTLWTSEARDTAPCGDSCSREGDHWVLDTRDCSSETEMILAASGHAFALTG